MSIPNSFYTPTPTWDKVTPHARLIGKTAAGNTRAEVLAFITGGWIISSDHLLIGPRATTQLIPEALTQEQVTLRSAILHSNAGPVGTRWEKIRNYIMQRGVDIEPHCDLNMDGWIAQFVPFNRKADCNFRANAWTWQGRRYGALSIETEDRGAATLQTTPWTLEQLDTTVATLTCAAVCYPIACTQPARWDDSGIGHHCLYPEWSVYRGKTCPGAARIRQMDYVRAGVTDRLARYGKAVPEFSCGWVA